MKHKHPDETQFDLTIQEYLDVIVNFGLSLKSDIIRKGETHKTYETALSALDRIIGFKAGAFALFDEFQLDCKITHWTPDMGKNDLEKELEHLIKEDVFAWVLQHNRWLCVPSSSGKERVLLSALSTREKTLGMFIAIVKDTTIAETYLKVISIILFICANTIENSIQYEEIKLYSNDLAKMVEKRTLELEKALEKANAANRAKSEFLANISHELLTPINGIVGIAQLIQQTEQPPLQKGQIDTIKTLGESLKNMINNILDFSRINTVDREPRAVEFQIKNLMDEVYSFHQAKASEKGIELSIRSRGRIPDTLTGDPDCLKKILFHLTDNAVKFTDKGIVTILVEPHSQNSPQEILLEFSIKDTGIGIAKHKIDALFSPFYQADGSASRRYQGIGLSLPLCKKLIEKMGGRISVASTHGKGSTVTVSAGFEFQPTATDIKFVIPEKLRLADPDQQDVAVLLEHLNGFDTAAGIEKAGMNQKNYLALIAKFGQEYDDAVEKIKEIIHKGNLEQGLHFIVNFIGICGTLGAMDLCQAAKDIQKGFKHSDSDNFKGLINRFEEKSRIVFDSIRNLKLSIPPEKASPNGKRQDMEQIKTLLIKINNAVKDNGFVDENLIPSLKEQISDPRLTIKAVQLEKAVSEFDYPTAESVIAQLLDHVDKSNLPGPFPHSLYPK